MNKPLSNLTAASFTRQLSIILQSGLSTAEGIELMHDDSTDENERQLLESIISEMNSGKTLAEALKSTNAFQDYMINMVELGETSGRLDDVFAALSSHYEREDDLRETIRSSMTYPLIMIIMVFVITAVIVAKVLPIFKNVFSQLGAGVSNTGLLLLSIGNAIGKYSVIIMAILILLIIGTLIACRSSKGRDKVLQRVSRVGFIRKIIDTADICRFANGMALTLSSGLSPENCLALTKTLAKDKAATDKIDKCIGLVEEGRDTYSAMMDAGLLSGLYSRLAAIGQKTGRMDQAMDEISRLSQKKLDEEVNSVLAVIEPTIVIVISVIIGAVILSVMLPLIGVMTVI